MTLCVCHGVRLALIWTTTRSFRRNGANRDDLRQQAIHWPPHQVMRPQRRQPVRVNRLKSCFQPGLAPRRAIQPLLANCGRTTAWRPHTYLWSDHRHQQLPVALSHHLAAHATASGVTCPLRRKRRWLRQEWFELLAACRAKCGFNTTMSMDFFPISSTEEITAFFPDD